MSTPKTACATGTCKRHRSTLGGLRSRASTPRLYSSGGFASTSRRMSSSTSGVDGPKRPASAVAAGRSSKWCLSIGDTQADRPYDATAKRSASGIIIRTTRRRFLTAEASATAPAKSRNGSMRAKSVVVVDIHQPALGYRPCGGQASTRSTLRPMQRTIQGAMARANRSDHASPPWLPPPTVPFTDWCSGSAGLLPAAHSAGYGRSQ